MQCKNEIELKKYIVIYFLKPLLLFILVAPSTQQM